MHCHHTLERLLKHRTPRPPAGGVQDYSKDPPTPRSQRLYLGCVENPHGYWPIRDPHSKWCASPRHS